MQKNSLQLFTQGVDQTDESVSGQSNVSSKTSWAAELENQMSLEAGGAGTTDTSLAVPAKSGTPILTASPSLKPIATPVRGPVMAPPIEIPVNGPVAKPVGPAPGPIAGPIQRPVSGPIGSPVKGPVVGPLHGSIENPGNGLSYTNFPMQNPSEPLLPQGPRGSEPQPIAPLTQAPGSQRPALFTEASMLHTLVAPSPSATNSATKTTAVSTTDAKSETKSVSLSAAIQNTNGLSLNGVADSVTVSGLNFPSAPQTTTPQIVTTPAVANTYNETARMREGNNASPSAGSLSSISSEHNSVAPDLGRGSAHPDAALTGLEQQGAGTVSTLSKMKGQQTEVVMPVNSQVLNPSLTQATSTTGERFQTNSTEMSTSLVAGPQPSLTTQTNEIQIAANQGLNFSNEGSEKISTNATGQKLQQLSAVPARQTQATANPASQSSETASGSDRSASINQSMAYGEIANLTPSHSPAQTITQTAPTGMLTGSATAASINSSPSEVTVANTHSGASPTPASANPFDGIDSGAPSQSPGWLRATSHQVEAGYHDPSMGWVEVRANEGTGGVHATLIPATPGAADTLGQHLAGMTNYLNERETPIATLNVASAAVQAGAGNEGHAAGSGSGQQGGQSGMNTRDENKGSDNQSNQLQSHAVNAITDRGSVPGSGGLTVGAFGSSASGFSYGAGSNGTRISVMA
jgi:trimeric autotransporter adhesin